MNIRRISDYPVIPPLAPVARVRRPRQHDSEPREGEHDAGPPPEDNDKPADLDDNPKRGRPGRLVDKFA
ncbi:MAG: hypothetical protein JJU27_14840 [Gammaproteobacteria bacterium]|nr:hypothetical protein [Gammaproteobacteria bacterium]